MPPLFLKDWVPASATKAQLRNVLNKHNVVYPSNAKKTDLVEIFEEKVRPNASKWLAEYNTRVTNSHDQGFLNAQDSGLKLTIQKNAEGELSRLSSTDDPSDTSSVMDQNAKVTKKKRNTKRTVSRETKVLTDDLYLKRVPSGGAKKLEEELRNFPTTNDKGGDSIGSNAKSKKNDLKLYSKLEEMEVNTDTTDMKSANHSDHSIDSDYSASDSKAGLSFSNDNVFQTRKRDLSKKKRKRTNDFESETKSPKVKVAKTHKSPEPNSKSSSRNTSQIISKQRSPNKSIFEDSDSEIFEYSVITKDDLNKLKSSPKVKHNDGKEHETSKATFDLEANLQTLETPVDLKYAESITGVDTRIGAADETDTNVNTKVMGAQYSPVIDQDFANLLGITIQGLEPTIKLETKPVRASTAKDEPVHSARPSSSELKQRTLLPHVSQTPLKTETESLSSHSSKHNGLNTPKHGSPFPTPQTKVRGVSSSSSSSLSKGKKQSSDISTTMLKTTPSTESAKYSTSTESKALNNSASRKIKRRIVTPISVNDLPRRPRTALTKSALTPKPRLISISSNQYFLDDEDEEEEEKEKEEEKNKKGEDGGMGEQELTEVGSKIIKAPKESAHSKDGHKGWKPISITSALFTFVSYSLVVFLAMFGYWYHEQKYLVGYCGLEVYQPTLSNSESVSLNQAGKFLDDHCKPNCIPCPSHARCFPNLELACYEDFVEYKPWYDFIIPGRKKCVSDTMKAEKLEIMIDVALDLLRTKNAQVSCGKGNDDEESGISSTVLHDLLLSMKAPYITIEEFEELWIKSVAELEKEPEVIVRQVRT